MSDEHFIHYTDPRVEWMHTKPGDLVMLYDAASPVHIPAKPTVGSAAGWAKLMPDDLMLVLDVKLILKSGNAHVTVQVIGRNIICMYCNPRATVKLVSRPSK